MVALFYAAKNFLICEVAPDALNTWRIRSFFCVSGNNFLLSASVLVVCRESVQRIWKRPYNGFSMYRYEMYASRLVVARIQMAAIHGLC